MSGTRPDIRDHNRIAWDALVDRGDPWTVPVSPKMIDAARRGEWTIVLTPIKPVPRAWLNVGGKDVFCLVAGGGQQGSILAAAGGAVTALDNSQKTLARHALGAERQRR